MLTGMFNKIYIFTIIILIHEMGHYLAGIIVGFKVEKIDIYPYGGCTKFNNDLNTSILKELFVLLSGPIVQILFFFILKDHISFNDYLLFKKYNYSILIFNLLPIYPLDGGRLLNLFFSSFLPYKRSFLISIYISLSICCLFVVKIDSLTLFLAFVLLVFNIIKEKNLNKYYYNKFLLERYLNKYSFKNRKIIDCSDNFYRSKKHLIRYNNRYYSEKEFLKNFFKNN